MRAGVLLAWLLPAFCFAATYDEPSGDQRHEIYSSFRANGINALCLDGKLVEAGQTVRLPARKLSAGHYKLRVDFIGEKHVTDPDLRLVLTDTGTGSARTYEALVTMPAYFQVTAPTTFEPRVTNTGKQRLLLCNHAYLRRSERRPNQTILYVPDAFGMFPDADPKGPFARLKSSGVFHSKYFSSGDNTIAFARKVFFEPAKTGKPMMSSLREGGIQTAHIGDNYYLLQYTDQRWFDYMAIREDAPGTDEEFNRRAIEWVRRRRDEDFVLYVHVLADHHFLPSQYRPETGERIFETVTALRDSAPEATLVLFPDHGQMLHHAWEASGKEQYGQGHGLYLETQHVPLLALGPEIPRGKICAKRSSTKDLQDALAEFVPGRRPLDPWLRCEAPEAARVVTESFAHQISVTDEAFHYIAYDPAAPYPAYTRSGALVRNKFLNHEALFDVVRDPHNTRDVGAEHPEALRDYRRLVRAARAARIPASTPAPTQTVQLHWMSPTCEAPPAPIVVRSNVVLRVVGQERVARVSQGDGSLTLTLDFQAPWCWRPLELEVMSGELDELHVSAPDSDVFLGRAYLKRRAEAHLEGAHAVGLVRDDDSGSGELFARNGGRGGVYVLLKIDADARFPELAPEKAGPGKRVAKRSKSAVSADDVRRMMRSWGYMREAEVVELR